MYWNIYKCFSLPIIKHKNDRSGNFWTDGKLLQLFKCYTHINIIRIVVIVPRKERYVKYICVLVGS